MAVILITGCSSGFGRLFALNLARAGHGIIATMRNPGRESELEQQAAQAGLYLKVLQLDVNDVDSISATIRWIEKEYGELHVVINNAGYGIGGFFEDLQESEIRAQLETNFFGVQRVIRTALPLLRKTASTAAEPVRIINISSIQGRLAMPGFSAYSSSKFALEGFSESLCFELQPLGIDVVLIEPGSFRTEIFAGNRQIASRGGREDSLYTPRSLKLLARVDNMLKTGSGMGDPERVARLVRKVVEARKVRLRYMIGKGAWFRFCLNRVLPWRVYRAILHRLIFGK